jgi:hypothetical protein
MKSAAVSRRAILILANDLNFARSLFWDFIALVVLLNKSAMIVCDINQGKTDLKKIRIWQVKMSTLITSASMQKQIMNWRLQN